MDLDADLNFTDKSAQILKELEIGNLACHSLFVN